MWENNTLLVPIICLEHFMTEEVAMRCTQCFKGGNKISGAEDFFE